MRPFQHRRTDRKYDGKTSDLAYLWHILFDGTRLCYCPHSTALKGKPPWPNP